MKRVTITVLALLGLFSFVLVGLDEEALAETMTRKLDTMYSFTEERFSLYGYLVNCSNVSFLTLDNEGNGSDFGNALHLRLKGDWSPEENLSFHTEISYAGKIGNQNPFVISEKYGVSTIDQTQFPLHDFNQTLSVDHVWGMANFARFDVQFGKMPIAWGTGYVFNPTAKVNTSSLFDTVTEETPGTLGISPSYSISEELAIEAYVAFQDKSHKFTAFKEDGAWQNIPYGIRMQGIFGSFDLSLSWIKEVMYKGDGHKDYQRAYYVGLDFAGAIHDFGVYGEAAINLPRNEDETAFDFEGHKFKDLLEACVGFDYTFAEINVLTRIEYYHQGRGETDKNKYDIMKMFTGEQILQGEDYLFAYAENTFHDRLRVGAGWLVNLSDGSIALVPEVTYDAYDNFQVSIGSFLFFGEEGSEFNGEHKLDGGKEIDVTEPSVYFKCKLSF